MGDRVEQLFDRGKKEMGIWKLSSAMKVSSSLLAVSGDVSPPESTSSLLSLDQGSSSAACFFLSLGEHVSVRIGNCQLI